MKHIGIIAAMLFYALSNLAAPTPEITDVAAPPKITDAEITALYDGYLLYEEYTRYSSESMEVDYASPDDSGLYFYKVVDETYDTWPEWVAFHRSIFTLDYVDELMENEDKYKSIDGDTYCRPGVMGWYLSKEYTYNIAEDRGDEVVLDIVRQEYDFDIMQRVDRTFSYLLRYTENGWRIASPLYY